MVRFQNKIPASEKFQRRVQKQDEQYNRNSTTIVSMKGFAGNEIRKKSGCLEGWNAVIR